MFGTDLAFIRFDPGAISHPSNAWLAWQECAGWMTSFTYSLAHFEEVPFESCN